MREWITGDAVRELADVIVGSKEPSASMIIERWLEVLPGFVESRSIVKPFPRSIPDWLVRPFYLPA